MTESKLQEALDLLDHGNRWTTGSFLDNDGRMCMVGALRAVHLILDAASLGAYCRDMERLAGVIPSTGWQRQSDIVTSFNDASATTWEDVALAFKKAIHDDGSDA